MLTTILYFYMLNTASRKRVRLRTKWDAMSCTSGFSFLINNRNMVEKRIGLRDSLLICVIKWSPSNSGIPKYVVAGAVTLLYRWLPSPLSYHATRLKERERNNSGNITTTRRAGRIFSCSFDSLMSR